MIKYLLIILAIISFKSTQAQTIGKQTYLQLNKDSGWIYLWPYYARATATYSPCIFYLSPNSDINILDNGLSYQVQSGFIPQINNKKAIVFSFHGDTSRIIPLAKQLFSLGYRIDTTMLYFTENNFADTVRFKLPDRSMFRFMRDFNNHIVVICRRDGSSQIIRNVDHVSEATNYITIYFINNSQKLVIQKK